jgi:hypothetical protein
MNHRRGVKFMGSIPRGSRWYIAGLVLEHTIEGDRRNVVHVNSHLVEADSPEEAYRKAVALGLAGVIEYANTEGRRVCVAFRGLRDLDVIHDDLGDGAELFYEKTVGVAEDDLRRWLKAKPDLGAFLPRCPETTGPNIMPEEIMRVLEAEGFSRPDMSSDAGRGGKDEP